MTPQELNYTRDPFGRPEFHVEKIGTRFCVLNQLGLIVQTFPTLEDAQRYLNRETA